MLVEAMLPVARQRLATIEPGALLADAAKLLCGDQINLVTVCNCDGTMVGVLTTSDVVRQISQCRFVRHDPLVTRDVFQPILVQLGLRRCEGCACTTEVANVMTRNVTVCHPGTLLLDVWLLMKREHFLHIPIIDDNNKPLGVLNARDALQALLSEAQDEEMLLRDYVMGVGYH